MGCVFARLPPLLLTILPLLSLDLSLDLSRPLSTSLSTSLAQPLPRPLRNRVYKVNNHPKFMNGEWTKKECLEDFLKKFEVNGVVDGTVTFEEFMNYYAGTPSTKQAKKQRTPLPPLPQQEQARNHSLRPLGVFERGGEENQDCNERCGVLNGHGWMLICTCPHALMGFFSLVWLCFVAATCRCECFD